METKTLPIIEPQPGQLVSGFVVSHWRGPHGEHCLVVAGGGVCLAYRVDPAVRLHPGDTVELRTVLLEKQDTPAWEVYVHKPGAGLQLVLGQHCASRTVAAEQWLKEIQTKILPDLVSEAERFRTGRLAQEAARHAINPTGQPELLYVTALASARKEVLGPDYIKACRAAEAAKHRCAKVAAALRRHHLVRESPHAPARLPWAWILRWRKSHRLRQHLKRANAWRRRAEVYHRRLERNANAPETIARIDRRAHELLKTDRAYCQQLAVLEREEKCASKMVFAAQQLVHYLQRRQGSLVKLEQTTVKGRPLSVPTIPGEATLRPNLRAHTAAVARLPATDRGPANDAKPLDHQEQTMVEAPHVQDSKPKMPIRTGPAKSNGAGMRI
jgi:hypothetical protein